MDNNIYNVLNDLQNNHRIYLDTVSNILRNERGGGFRNSVRRASARAQASSTPVPLMTTPLTTTPLMSVPLTSVPLTTTARPSSSMTSSIASQILSMLSSPSTDSLTFEFLLNPNSTTVDSSVDISNNTTVYAQPELEEQPVCPITLEPIEAGTNVMKITRCGHVFKELALRRWLIRDRRCPVCRGALH